MSNLVTRNYRPATPAAFARLPGRSDMIVGNDGHINASSQQDLAKTLMALSSQIQNGALTTENPSEGREMTTAEKFEVFQEARRDPSGKAWQALGSQIGLRVYESANREGFMRRLLLRGEVSQGSFPRVEVKQKNVTAQVAVGTAEQRAEIARERYVMPPEFSIKANVRVDTLETLQGSSDIMESAYANAQEQIMVQEDKMLKMLLDNTIGIPNNQKTLASGLTPASLSNQISDITRWNLPVSTMLMASDVWQDVVGNAAVWGQLLDQVSRYEIVQTGYLGTLLGLGIVTDAFRHPLLKVLSAGDIYILSTPEMLGGYTDRGPVSVEPVDGAFVGSTSRGWFMYEFMSMVVANGRAVSKATRN